MEDLSVLLLISIAVPLTAMLFVFKSDSRTSLLFLLAGMLVCLLAGQINTVLLNLTPGMTVNFFVVNISPLVEELCKAVPLFLYVYIMRPRRQLILQCAVAIGVGFAVLENAVVFAEMMGSLSLMTALIRGFGSGLMHAISTLWIGYGIVLIYLNRKLFYTGSIAILIVASVFHSIYNALIQSSYELVGLILPTVTFIPLLEMLIRKKRGNNQDISKVRYDDEKVF